MPVIERHILNCAFYAYPSEKAANDGISVGGCGFLVGIPPALPNWFHFYAVTNQHVLDGGNHILRINTTDGKFATIPTQPDEWTSVPEDDVAVLPLDLAGC